MTSSARRTPFRRPTAWMTLGAVLLLAFAVRHEYHKYITQTQSIGECQKIGVAPMAAGASPVSRKIAAARAGLSPLKATDTPRPPRHIQPDEHHAVELIGKSRVEGGPVGNSFGPALGLQNRIDACYGAALAATPVFAGTLQIRLELAAGGRTVRAELAPTPSVSTFPQSFLSCVNAASLEDLYTAENPAIVTSSYKLSITPPIVDCTRGGHGRR